MKKILIMITLRVCCEQGKNKMLHIKCEKIDLFDIKIKFDTSIICIVN